MVLTDWFDNSRENEHDISMAFACSGTPVPKSTSRLNDDLKAERHHISMASIAFKAIMPGGTNGLNGYIPARPISFLDGQHMV